MRLKITTGLLLSYLLLPVLLSASVTDSIRQVELSGSLYYGPTGLPLSFEALPHPFFDTDAHTIYVRVDVMAGTVTAPASFVFLEIKKKSIQQFRLRPIVAKRTELLGDRMIIDSLELTDSLFGSGNYDVIATLMKDSLHVLDVKKVSFQLLRSRRAAARDEFYEVDSVQHGNQPPVEQTFVNNYDLAQLRRNIQTLAPLAKGAEKKVMEALANSGDLLTLKQFFYNFWYNRNPGDPEKAWTDYKVILNEVGKKYGNSNTPGYQTDRGRIYIQYGAPDRIERINNEKEALPHEIWFYYHSGNKNNVKFLFFQPGMLSNEVILLQSNVPEELINPYWKMLLFTNPNDGDLKLKHKAFEFFN